jgi:hypothetical protein
VNHNPGQCPYGGTFGYCTFWLDTYRPWAEGAATVAILVVVIGLFALLGAIGSKPEKRRRPVTQVADAQGPGIPGSPSGTSNSATSPAAQAPSSGAAAKPTLAELRWKARGELARETEAYRKEQERYGYYSVRAVHADSIDLMTNEGEIRSGVVIEDGPEAMANMEVGGRITWDGERWKNYVSPSKLRDVKRQVRRFNDLPNGQRIKIAREDQQGLRECGYVLEWRANQGVVLVSVEEEARLKAIAWQVEREAAKPFRFNL